MRPIAYCWSFLQVSLFVRMVLSWSPKKNALQETFMLRRTSAWETSTTSLQVKVPLPFFATPEVNEKLNEGRASITSRLPIGKLFDSRDYIFSTTSNVRAYEWTLKETEELLDDLVDASNGAYYSTALDDPSASSSSQQEVQDYELSQIVLIPKDWNKDAFGLGGLYDVYDGQQRLVTLCLIFAAMRERFRKLDDMGDTVDELANMLKPTKTRKADIVRIELNQRDNVLLAHLLNCEMDKVEKLRDEASATKMSSANQRISENFGYISKRFETFSEEGLLALLDFIVEKVYLLVCIPESASIARNIVMGQGKGKDNEPIDDFKGLVCFRYTEDEKKMYQTFDEWDALSSSVIDIDAGVVGRQTVSDACSLRASAYWRTKIGSRKQLFWWEQWLRSDVTTHGYQGSDFFQKKVQPASLTLGQFRDGSTIPFGFSKSGKITKFSPGIDTRLTFIRELIKGVSSTKEVEMIILELLLRAGSSVVAAGHTKPMPLSDLEQYLHRVEELVLYFSLLRPTATIKNSKCFTFLDVLNNAENSKQGIAMLTDDLLSPEERSKMHDALANSDLGVNASGKRLVSALLKRLNCYCAINNEDAPTTPTYYLEPILPIKATKKAWGDVWPEKAERERWVHKVGNLCLVSQKLPAKEAKASFSEKKKRYGGESKNLPLTLKLEAREKDWDAAAIQDSSLEVAALVKSLWGS